MSLVHVVSVFGCDGFHWHVGNKGGGGKMVVVVKRKKSEKKVMWGKSDEKSEKGRKTQ